MEPFFLLNQILLFLLKIFQVKEQKSDHCNKKVIAENPYPTPKKETARPHQIMYFFKMRNIFLFGLSSSFTPVCTQAPFIQAVYKTTLHLEDYCRLLGML